MSATSVDDFFAQAAQVQGDLDEARRENKALRAEIDQLRKDIAALTADKKALEDKTADRDAVEAKFHASSDEAAALSATVRRLERLVEEQQPSVDALAALAETVLAVANRKK